MRKEKQDSPKITTAEKKIKDLERDWLWLANKQMSEKIKTEMDEQNDSSKYNYTYIFGAAGVSVSIVGLYYTRKQFVRTEGA